MRTWNEELVIFSACINILARSGSDLYLLEIDASSAEGRLRYIII